MPSSEALVSPDTLRHQAMVLVQRNDLVAARTVLEALVEQRPADLTARLDLAHVVMKSGAFRASTACLVAALPQDGEASFASRVTLARRLIFSGEVVASRSCIQRLETTVRQDGPMLAAVAYLYWLIGDIAKASDCISRAREIGVDTPNEWHLHAMLCHFQGQREQSREILEACLQRWPRFGAAAQALANLRSYGPDENHIRCLQSQLEQLPHEASDPCVATVRAQFLSALSKELDDLGDSAASWEALVQSKVIMRTLHPYAQAMESTFTSELIAAMARLSSSPSERRGKTDDRGAMPIFVVGMPRSGSTLLDRVLSSHPDVASAGEINDFLRQLHWVADVPPSGVTGMREVLRRLPRLDLTEIGRRYLAQTRWRAEGMSYFVDKLPINIQLVPLIRRALPGAPILHIIRDPMDVCFSNFRAMFGDVTPWCNDLASVAHFHGEYRRMVSQWDTDFPGAMLDVDYRALIESPEPTIRNILAYCGLPFDERCLHPQSNPAPVTTPSAAQVREPMHRRGLSSWHRYATQLAPLRAALSWADA